MRSDSHRPQVLDAFRRHVESTGSSPTYKELGRMVGISDCAAWKNVDALVYDGKLVRDGREIRLPDDNSLTTARTDDLRRELARRGVTMDALAEPRLLSDQGRPCAANHCSRRVRRGHLMCREHWFKLTPEHRSDILRAFGARQVQAYQEAVERARDYLGGFTRVVERVA